MASISKVVKISVSLLTAGVKEAGFGIPLVVDFHTRFIEMARSYSDPDEMLGDGFTVNDAAHQAVAAIFAQQPSPEEVVVGRRTLAPDQEVRITPTAFNNKHYKLEVTEASGVVTNVDYLSDGTATVLEIITNLIAAIDPLASLTAVAGGGNTYVTVKATAPGIFFAIKVIEDGIAAGFAGLKLTQVHADPGIATDLAAIKLANDTWYGLTLTTQGAAEIAAASSWCESVDKQMVQATQDGNCISTDVDDIMTTCKTANRFRTGLLFHHNPKQHAGAAWMGSVFPIDPGAITYAFRRLRNVDSSPLSTTQMNNVEGKNGNYFVDIGGNGVTFGKDGGGKASSGEWLDIIRDTDWYEVQLGVEHLAVKLNNNKVPMTNGGIAMEETALRTATERAIKAGFLDGDSVAYSIPDISEIPSNKRAARTLDKLKVSARVQGAIHITEIVATLTS